MAESYVFTVSPVVQRRDDDQLHGSFVPDGPVRVGAESTRLRRLLGDGFVGLCFAPDAAHAAELVDAARARPWRIPARLVVVLPAGTAAGDLPAHVTVAHAEDPALLRDY